jgi:two-component system sensor histidine kinase EvgS
LIAEDIKTNALVLETMLEDLLGEECRVVHAENGEEAVERCKENAEINLVLMDVKMPVMDGVEATKEIKKIRPDLLIVALSAYTLVEDINRAKSAGCVDYIAKPVSKSSLSNVLRALNLMA